MTALRTGVFSCRAVVSQHVFCASLVAWFVVSQGIATTVVYGQSRAAHRYYHSEAPPGAIGRAQQLRGGPSRGFLQPVRIKAPAGALIAPAESGSFPRAKPGVRDIGLLVGLPYRIRVSNIPLMEDVAVYPTIELLDRTYPPAELRWKYPIPIELTMEELRLAAGGKLVVRVVYIEDPAMPLPSSDAADPSQRYFEVFSDEDPLHVADELGRPVALVRIGSRTPPVTGPAEDFCFGSPPFEFKPKWDDQIPARRPFTLEDPHASATGEQNPPADRPLRQAAARHAMLARPAR